MRKKPPSKTSAHPPARRLAVNARAETMRENSAAICPAIFARHPREDSVEDHSRNAKTSRKCRISLPSNMDFIELTFELIPFFLDFPTIDVNFVHDGHSILLIAVRTHNYD
jgi:hypothetical protein